MTADTRTSLVSELRRLRLLDERLFDERLLAERLFVERPFVERFFVDWLRRVDEEADGVMRDSGRHGVRERPCGSALRDVAPSIQCLQHSHGYYP